MLVCSGVALAVMVRASSRPPGVRTASAVTLAAASSVTPVRTMRLEPGELDLHLVDARRQRRGDVVAGAVRDVGPRDLRGLARYLDRRPRDDCALRVADEAADLSRVELGVQGCGQRQSQQGKREDAPLAGFRGQHVFPPLGWSRPRGARARAGASWRPPTPRPRDEMLKPLSPSNLVTRRPADKGQTPKLPGKTNAIDIPPGTAVASAETGIRHPLSPPKGAPNAFVWTH